MLSVAIAGVFAWRGLVTYVVLSLEGEYWLTTRFRLARIEHSPRHGVVTADVHVDKRLPRRIRHGRFKRHTGPADDGGEAEVVPLVERKAVRAESRWQAAHRAAAPKGSN